MSKDDQEQNKGLRDLEALRALFQRILRLPEAEREAALRNADAGAGLKAQVGRLLVAHAEPRIDVEGIVSEAAEAAAIATDRYVGSEIGNYRILDLIDEGGMGRVYLAYRDDDQFDRNVAIKILGSRIPGEDLLRRFRVERQILANLALPYIARLLDGGETDDGLPYLVMEYVDGVPVLDHCEEKGLSFNDRLNLFLKICSAIQHAHQNFIIHRDIKSSNILVVNDGTPRVLDFGIAKLLRPDDTSFTVAETVADARLLTPANASPEQLTGRAITTATDVYALGLLLYELLTGQPPYMIEGQSRGEMERIICETDPEKPSVKVTAAESRGTTSPPSPGRARRVLAGDLDTIILTALRKEPDRRYPTVDALAADIRNYLAHRPVTARPESVTYRLGKFARRQRAGLAIGGAVALLLGVAVMQVISERNRASAEAANSRAAVDFLVDMFQSSDPNTAQGEELTARDALNRGAAKLDSDTTISLETRALLTRTVGAVYRNLGAYAESEEQLRASAAHYESIGDSQGLVTSLTHLAATLSLKANGPESTEVAQRALELAESVYPDPHVELANVLHETGSVMGNASGPAESLPYLERAIAMYEALGLMDSEGYVEALYVQGEANMVLGNHDEAEALLRHALAVATDRYGERNTSTIKYIQTLAITLHEAGKYEEALPYYLKNNELEIALLGEDHPDREYTLTSLGRLYRHMGRIDEAEGYLRAAVELARRALGEDHVFTAYDTANLANLLRDQGRLDEAEALYLEALRIYGVAFSEPHHYTASAHLGVSGLYFQADRIQDAKQHAELALESFSAVLPADHALVGSSKTAVGRSLYAEGDYQAAQPYLIEGFELMSGTRGDDGRLIPVIEALIDVHRQLGDDAGVATYQQELDAREE